MTNLKEALEYIVELKEPTITEVCGHTFSDKSLHRVDNIPRASAIKMTTLSSLVDYIKSSIDLMPCMIIHVQSPTHIEMYSALNSDRQRECLVEVDAQIPSFAFNQFMDHESFCINLQSKFLDNSDTDKALLLKFAGTAEAGTIAEYGDDGVTQKATVKSGIASKCEAIVPNSVNLQSFRTFVEVEQPQSSYVFRMKQNKYDGIDCALFEADGGAWKIAAMKSIKIYLEEQLKGIEGFIVIS